MGGGKIWVASDHAGFSLKEEIIAKLSDELPSFDFEDLGCRSTASVDYPEFAAKVAEKVAAGEGRGILVCGSGIGMSIAANKIAGIRASVVSEPTAARLTRLHNDSNVLCLGARLIGVEVALECCRVWLQTAFEGGRHQKRVDGIAALERNAR